MYTIYIHSGEGNGNPLQYCLGSPVDGGAWWAAVCGVAQSQTRLKRQQQQQHIHSVIVICVYVYILFHIILHYGLLLDIEYSCLYCTVGPCCLSVDTLYIVVCICSSQTPNLCLYPLVTISFFPV